MTAFVLAALLVTAEPAAIDLQRQVEARLSEAGPGTRFGLVVTTLEGTELVVIAPDQRFIPASNAKILTTAAAFDNLEGLDLPDAEGGARVRLEERTRGAPDVVLEGRGDARLSSAPDCVTNCLAALADAVAARTRRVHRVIGDARYFPDERWSQGMSWNNVATSSGTAVAALALDRNELALRVDPAAPGKPPTLSTANYYEVDNRATTEGEASNLALARLPGSRLLHLSGRIAPSAQTRLLRLGVDDPAHFTAWRFKAMLQERGVTVESGVVSRYRPAGAADFAQPETPDLARLTPGPLLESLTTINKVSQNLYAEMLLRRLGREKGNGSAEAGVAKVRATMERAGVPSHAWHLADGSGMSTYNRITPRGMTTLLRWIARQTWGGRWKETLAIGGVDGTLARRFASGPLKGRVFAKTGSLNATSALAGFLLTKRGETLVFAIYANDIPEEVSATPLMDAALELVAAQR